MGKHPRGPADFKKCESTLQSLHAGLGWTSITHEQIRPEHFISRPHVTSSGKSVTQTVLIDYSRAKYATLGWESGEEMKKLRVAFGVATLGDFEPMGLTDGHGVPAGGLTQSLHLHVQVPSSISTGEERLHSQQQSGSQIRGRSKPHVYEKEHKEIQQSGSHHVPHLRETLPAVCKNIKAEVAETSQMPVILQQRAIAGQGRRGWGGSVRGVLQPSACEKKGGQSFHKVSRI